MQRPHSKLLWSGLGLLVIASLACDRDEGPSAAPSPKGPAAGTESTPEQATAAEEPRVVFLGDSISAGLHLPGREAFPAVLQRELAQDGVAFELVNAGISGDTSAGGLRRLDWLLKQDPDVVVVQLGANDGLRGQPPAEMKKNLRAILVRLRERGVRALLLGMRLPSSYGAQYTEQFAAVYPALAEELSVPFVPFFMQGVAGVPELNLPDGLHPTAEGHERLADNVAPGLREVIASLE